MMMNMIKRLSGVLLALCLVAPMLSAQSEGKQSTHLWSYSEPVMKYIAATEHDPIAQLSIQLEVTPERELKSTEIIKVQPLLVSKDGRHRCQLPATFVAGSNRYKYIKRADNLGHSRVYPEIALSDIRTWREVKATPFAIAQKVPFEPWMASATLMIQEELSGCASCGVQNYRNPLKAVDIPLFIPDISKMAYHQPMVVRQKEYEEEFVSYINFKLDRYELLKDYKDNQNELRRIDEFITKALKLNELGATIGKVEVTGFASPEGNFDYNRRLSRNRANTLMNHVKATYPDLLKAAEFEVIGGGEDWAGLRHALFNSTASFKDQVIAIIDKYDTDLEREADIKAIDGGALYKTLLTEYYPPLRQTTIKTKYKVRNYTTEELPKVYQEKRELMSHSELLALAINHYEQQGKSPVEVLRYANERFGKEDPIARYNLALAILKWEPEKSKEALELLNTLPKTSDENYLRATALYQLGDQEGAYKLMH